MFLTSCTRTEPSNPAPSPGLSLRAPTQVSAVEQELQATRRMWRSEKHTEVLSTQRTRRARQPTRHTHTHAWAAPCEDRMRRRACGVGTYVVLVFKVKPLTRGCYETDDSDRISGGERETAQGPAQGKKHLKKGTRDFAYDSKAHQPLSRAFVSSPIPIFSLLSALPMAWHGSPRP